MVANRSRHHRQVALATLRTMRGKSAVRRLLRRAGWDIARWPLQGDAAGHARVAARIYHVDHVVDVGANFGQFARYLRTTGYKGPMTSFEPLPGASQALKQMAAKDPGWTIHDVALGGERATATLNVSESTVMSSLLRSNQNLTDRLPKGRTVQEVEVQVRPLTDYGDQLAGRSMLLKIDTQGYDLHVLRGAGSVLDRVSVLMLELAVIPNYDAADNLWMDSVEYVQDLGFELAGMFTIGRDAQYRAREMDGLFVRNLM